MSTNETTIRVSDGEILRRLDQSFYLGRWDAVLADIVMERAQISHRPWTCVCFPLEECLEFTGRYLKAKHLERWYDNSTMEYVFVYS